MLNDLKRKVWEANMLLPRLNLVIATWGNVSGIDREKGLVVIKPSGIAYENMREEDMVVMNLRGEKIEGALNPSSDTPTHLELYRRFPALGGITHTHSRWAVCWAQAGRDLPAYGTTHADHFYGPVPCARNLTKDEVERAYELETGRVIAECFEARGITPEEVPAVLARCHGPFAFGKSALDSVHNAQALEECAMMAFYTEALGNIAPMPDYILDKHYLRKHGPGAYYGQKEEK